MAEREARDPLFGKAVVAAAGLLPTVAFGWAAIEIRDMRATLNGLVVKAAVIEAARYGDEIKALDARVRTLEQKGVAR